jgi:ribonuclease G
MSKELFVSSTPHQTKVALVEDDLLSEVYFERENEYTLAGSIYKGRVTRVLPGMQSAFVDIGLERDAFLYVSDFFEMEDDEEAFEPIPAARPFEMKPSEPRPEPMNFAAAPQPGTQPGMTEALEGGYAPDAEVEKVSGEAGEKEGGRGWRGRRRRGRGRGRGFPESKFAHPASGGGESAATENADAAEEESADETFDKPLYKPIILPGESLAKFRKRPEAQPETSAVEPKGQHAEEHHAEEHHADEQDADEQQEEARDDSAERDSYQPRSAATQPEGEAAESERPQRHAPPSSQQHQPPQYQPIMLPGESISKYRKSEASTTENADEAAPPAREASFSRDDRRGRRRGFERDRGPRERDNRPPEREYETPRPFEPIMLPGESISKYRKLQQQPLEPTSESETAVPATSVGVEAAGDEQQNVWGQVPSPAPASTEEHHDYRDEPQDRHQAVSAREAAEPLNAVEADEQIEETHSASGIASEVDEDSAVPEINEEPSHQTEYQKHDEFPEQHEHEEQPQYLAPDFHVEDSHSEEDQSPAEAPNYSAAAAGSYVEEEIETEEEDLPHPAESLYEEDEFEELEEEILEPAPFIASGASEVAEATNGAAVFEGGYEGDEEEEDEIAAAEKAAYAEIGEPEAARAELRGPSGTAGYQQRTQRPEYDRQRRGRRGGSGGGGGRRFGGGGRGPRRESMQRQHVVISDL